MSSSNNKESKKPEKKIKMKKVTCQHDYGYCYYNHKERENVYRCVHCGKWLYQ